MKRLSAILLLLLLVLAPAGLVRALGLNGRNSFETLSLTYNARFFALAGAGIALVDDVNAGLMNSARLSGIKGFEFSVSGNSHFAGSLGGQASIAYPMPFGVFAGSLVYFNYGEAELRQDVDDAPRFYSPSDILAVVSFGNRLGRSVSYGLNLKYVQESLTADDSMFGFAADLSVLVDGIVAPGLDLGLTVNNLGVITREGFRDNNLPISIVLGMAYAAEFEFPVAGIYDIKPCLDLEMTADLKPRVLFGSEFCWYHVAGDLDLTGRAGFSWPSDPGILTGFRLGLGADLRNFSLDYGIGWMGDLGFIHKVSFTFKAAAPEPKRFVESVSRKKIDKDLEDFNKAFNQDDGKPVDREKAPARPKTGKKPEQPQLDRKPPPKTQSTNVAPAKEPPSGDDEFDFEE
jgi:hypothetical protein